MPKVVEVPGVGNVEFPDGMGDDQIAAALKAQTSQPERSVSGFVDNVVTSGGKMLSDIGSAVVHPIDTLGGIASVGAGAVEKLIPGQQSHEPSVNAVVDFYKQRYGGLEQFKKTAYEDPVGVLADFSTLLTGAGGAAKGLGAVAKAAKAGGTAAKLARAGEMAVRAGDALSPTRAVTEPVKAAVRGAGGITGIESLNPERLYQSALKPRLGMGPEKVSEVVKTGLREGIPVSKQGLAQVQDLMDGINQEISGKITAKAAAGAKVNSADVAAKLDDVRAFFKDTVAPQGMLKEIDALQKQFQAAHGKTIPVDKAQQLKQNTYVLLKRAYGEMKSAQVEGQKALARGLKDEIVKIVPEVADLNARESKLIGLESALERYVSREGNHQMTGLGTPSITGAAGIATGSKVAAMAAGALRGALENPTIKSKLAIAIARSQARGGGKAAAAARAVGPILNPRAILAARLQQAVAQ